MQRLTEQAHALCRERLHPGDIAVDATAGNGHDTLFLAQQVGPTGTVFAFDIQAEALETTARRLAQHGLRNVVLIDRDHAALLEAVPAEQHGNVAVVMFNLGYRPGGDKTRTTQPDSTRSALAQSLQLLQPGGLLTVLAYTGHPGGDAETAAVRSFISAYEPSICDPREITAAADRESPPVLFAMRKR